MRVEQVLSDVRTLIPWDFKTLLIASVGLYVVTTLWGLVYNLYFHPLAKYPGMGPFHLRNLEYLLRTSSGPALRAAFEFPKAFSGLKGRGFADIKLLHDKFGSVVRVSPSLLSFNTAQAWKDIYGLKSDRTELYKDLSYYESTPNDILVAPQPHHTRIRKHFAHAFSDTALLEQEPLLTQYFDLLIARLEEQISGPCNGRVNITAYYNFTTFDIIGHFMFGEPFGCLQSGEYHPWISTIFAAIKYFGVLRFIATYPILELNLKALLKVVPSLSAKRDEHFRFAIEKIENHLQNRTESKDFLSYLLSRVDDRGLSRDEIVDSGRTLILAGSETTATMLSGLTYHLLRNPTVLHRVQSEVRAAFQNQDEITLRSVSKTGLLPYMEAVIQESFRMYPPVPAILPRITGSGGAIIDGNFVPKNVSVGVHQWSTYRSSANFACPDTFDPERWLPDPPAKYRGDVKAALQPFHLGPRGCVGKSLAYHEIRSILARVLWNFDLQLDEATRNWEDQGEYVIWDKPPLWVRLKHRAVQSM
ncbi:hypothetical protein XPA_000851 [Xanthoria parietina]